MNQDEVPDIGKPEPSPGNLGVLAAVAFTALPAIGVVLLVIQALSRGRFLGFATPIVVVFVVVASLLNNLRRGGPVILGRPRPREQGIWSDPPPAELDKSTFGLLLADRLRRDPGIHVVVPRPESGPPAPASAHELWDRELDG